MNRWVLASALALCAQTSLAATSKKPPEDPDVARWAQSPSDADFERVLPPETVKSQVRGRALMRCQATADGGLADCALIADSASSAGFGKALLALAGQYKLKPEALAAMHGDRTIVVSFNQMPVDKDINWLRRPSAEDLAVVWPKSAWSRGIGGKATISCLVSVQGAVYDCVTISETPAGENFGAAAIALTPQFLMKPAIFKGEPVVAEARIPINFAWQAGAGGGGSGGHRVAQPAMAWLEAPSYAQVIAAYPKKAKSEGVIGRATLGCEFISTGKVEHCQTIVEEPKGQGFGEAARSLSKLFRAPPTTGDGKSWSGVEVQLPFAFDRSMQTDKIPAVGTPKWAKLPSVEETVAAFANVSKTVEGTVRVTLNCTVQTGGTVGGCTVVREDPAGKGVGEAALALAPHFHLTTWTMEGLPTIGAAINIPLRFEGKPPAETPAPAKP